MALIACVEDDEKIAANLVLRLREAGHGVVRFASGEEAFRGLRDDGNAQPDMLLVDARLPAMSGIDLLGALGADRAPTVIISGEASMAETIEAMRLGVHDFLDKHVSRARLLKTVENCLEHAALRRQVDDLRAREQRILGDSAPGRALLATDRKVAETGDFGDG